MAAQTMIDFTRWLWLWRGPKRLDFISIGYPVVYEAVTRACPKHFITDSAYKTVGYLDIEPMFQANTGKFMKYRENEYDCDDFARTASATLHILFGNVAVGEAAVALDSGGNHMLNFVVTRDGEIVYVEPQTNKIVTRVDFKPYFMII